MLLPSCPSPSASDLSATAVTQASDGEEINESVREAEPPKPDISDDARILEMNRRAHAAVEGLREEATRLAYSGKCLMPYSLSYVFPEATSRHVAITFRSFPS